MNTDRTIILTMLANQHINTDEAERLLILTEALHRVERLPHPATSDEPIMSQLIGDLENSEHHSHDHVDLDYLTDLNNLVDFETLTGMEGLEDFFSLPDLPPFPEMIDARVFVNLPDEMRVDGDEIIGQFRDLHERLDHMKDHFAEFKDKLTTWQDDIGFDGEML